MEYDLVTEAGRTGRQGITADLVEMIAYQSDNTAFQSPEFRRALADFRKYRCKTPNKVQFSLDREIQAIKHQLKIKD